MEYGNSGVSDSVATRTFEPSQNWTRMGVKYLSLYIHGDLRNISGQFYIEVNGKKVPFDGDANALTTPKWTRWVIELATLGINTTKVTEMVIGVSGVGSSGKVYVDDITLVESALIAEEIYLEAEAADSISEPMTIVDDVTAMGGQYIMMSADAVRDVNLPANENDGVAQYAFTVAGGTYQVACRVSCPAGGSLDSCFVRILGATTNTGTLEGGWINWNPMTEIKPDIWVWEDVLNFDQGSQKVLFTMDAGTYTLEIGRREQEAKIDAIVISEVVE
jgi:hypothetical protein